MEFQYKHKTQIAEPIYEWFLFVRYLLKFIHNWINEILINITQVNYLNLII